MNIPILTAVNKIYPHSADVLNEGKYFSISAPGQTKNSTGKLTPREKKKVTNKKRDYFFSLLDENFGTPTKVLMEKAEISRTTFYRWRDEYTSIKRINYVNNR